MFHDASNHGDHRAEHGYSSEQENKTQKRHSFFTGLRRVSSSRRASMDAPTYQGETDILETANVWSEASTSDLAYDQATEETVSESTASWMLRYRKRTVTETERIASQSNRNNAHRRHATESSVSAESKYSRASAISHPLQSQLHPTFTQSESALGLDLDATVTRPTLKRLLSSGEFAHTRVSVKEGEGSGKAEEDSVEVIVHEVSEADSFAGVALRYGISVADLRRVNQLWASDSIHLKKMLYIPLSLPIKGKRKDENVGNSPSSIIRGSNTGDTNVNNVMTQSSAVDEDITLPDFPVIKIPTSQLAFFPRGVQKKSQRQGRLELADRQIAARPPSSFPTSMSGDRLSPHGRKLSALFNAVPHPLPMPLFSDDSRRSLDSNSLRSSLSTESENPLTQTHEMDILRPQIQARKLSREDSSKILYLGQSIDSDEEREVGDAYVMTPRQRRKRSTSLPRAKTREYQVINGTDEVAAAPAVVRTKQLQPSPNMRFPRRR